jgi:hypothetical protein
MLVAWLDYGRATLLAKCEGLSREALVERSVPPSDLTLLGLVRHRTEGEHYWFSRVLGREDAPPLYYDDEEVDPDGEFHPPADVDAEADLAAFRAECDRSRALVAAQPSLEVTGKRPRGAGVLAVDPAAHDRGVRSAQRSRRPPAGAHRRRDGGVAAASAVPPPDTLNLSRESPRLV